MIGKKHISNRDPRNLFQSPNISNFQIELKK